MIGGNLCFPYQPWQWSRDCYPITKGAVKAACEPEMKKGAT